MKRIDVDRQAIRFSKNKYSVNVFWRDLIGRRGFQFFLRQLIKGLQLLTHEDLGYHLFLQTNYLFQKN